VCGRDARGAGDMHAPTNMLVSETSEPGDTNERTDGRAAVAAEAAGWDARWTDRCRCTLGTAADSAPDGPKRVDGPAGGRDGAGGRTPIGPAVRSV